MTPHLIVRRQTVRAPRTVARVALALLACAAWVPPALGQPEAASPPATTSPPPSNEDPNVVAAARALAVEGVKLAQADRCEEAIDKLERAEQLRHSAIVLSQLGECYIAQGRFVEGAEAMRSVIREGEPENPSEAMKKAHAQARTLLETAKAKIASLTITLEAPPGAQAEVTVDGQAVPAALVGAVRPTDPGEHTIEAKAPGLLPARRRITLAPGETDAVTLALVVDPAAQEQTSAAAAAPEAAQPNRGAATAPPPKAASASPNYLPAYIAWGAGTAALAVGVAFGWVAMDQKSDLDRVCPNQRCPPEQSARLDAAKTNGAISSVAFGVGIGAAALGGVLFFLASGDEDQPPSAASALFVDPTGVRVTF